MRVGFLFNHDQIHQVAHSLPVALALARQRPDLKIELATAGAAIAAEVGQLTGGTLPPNVTHRALRLSRRSSRIAAALARGIAPAGKLLFYRDNLDWFRSLDLLVVSEKTSLLLKQRYGLPLRIVHTRHGAGDRAIGFDKASAAFDHILVSGPKVRDRLIAEAGVAPARISIVGYPKFDLHAETRADSLFAEPDDRPIVLYNPHPSPHLSSWYRMGRQILDWFVAHDEYRLIFAPHVMLFERRFTLTIDRLRIDRPGRLAKRYWQAPNIAIDLRSRALSTMAYTNMADIYLGDVSSQVYEFLIRPRPCVFADAHDTDWANDRSYAHWASGPVIRSVAELGSALTLAQERHAERYAPVQRRLFDASFDLTGEPSSERAARVIQRLADEAGRDSKPA